MGSLLSERNHYSSSQVGEVAVSAKSLCTRKSCQKRKMRLITVWMEYFKRLAGLEWIKMGAKQNFGKAKRGGLYPTLDGNELIKKLKMTNKS